MPRRIYTPEMQAFIAENVQGRHYSELAELVSATFGIEMTTSQIHAYVDATVKRFVMVTGNNNVVCIRNGRKLSQKEINKIFAE